MTWNYLNPFTEYPNRPGHTRTRYKHADRVLGGNISRLLCTRRPSRQHYRFSPMSTGSCLSIASMPIEIVSEFLHLLEDYLPTTLRQQQSPNLLGDWTTTMKMLINNPGSGSDPQMRYFCVCRMETSTKRGSKGRLGEDQIVKEPMYGRGWKEITAIPWFCHR
jgi:hypothetical protein